MECFSENLLVATRSDFVSPARTSQNPECDNTVIIKGRGLQENPDYS